VSFKADMRRFAADLRAAVGRGMKHWSTGLWVGFFDNGYPMLSFDQKDCGCLFGGAISTPMTNDFVDAIKIAYPSFGFYHDETSPAGLISDASEAGVDFTSMADFIDNTPDWALDEYERGMEEVKS